MGINGFGRIGRAITRANWQNPAFDLVAINDINPDKNNLAYLLKYDTTYGRFPDSVEVQGDYLVLGGKSRALISHAKEVDQAPWAQEKVDLVIDSSGVGRNRELLPNLKDQGVKWTVVTNTPDSGVDRYVVMGVNEGDITDQDYVISSSICDTSAFLPVAKLVDDAFGINNGFITTLHPWLNYQNLLDGPSYSFSDPGHIWSTYVLGRASMNALIPKTTSTLKASAKVLEWVGEKFMSMSYRVPTNVVCSADLSMRLSRPVNSREVAELFQEAEAQQSIPVLHNSHEALTSVDFIAEPYSVVVDHRWIMVQRERFLKLVLWYDNEWGYSCRVNDLVHYLERTFMSGQDC